MCAMMGPNQSASARAISIAFSKLCDDDSFDARLRNGDV